MESKFEPSDLIRRSATSEGEAAGDDYFVLDLDTGQYYSFGEVGGFIWERLDGDTPLAQIAQGVTTDFDVGADEATADVLEFVDGLASLGLLEVE